MRITRGRSLVGVAAGAVLVTLLLAGFVSPFASSDPDGLHKVAIDQGFDHHAEDSAVADSPLAEYAVKDVQNEKVSTGLAGVAGVLITLLVAGAVFGGLGVCARRRRAPAGPGSSASPLTASG